MGTALWKHTFKNNNDETTNWTVYNSIVLTNLHRGPDTWTGILKNGTEFSNIFSNIFYPNLLFE